MTRAVDLLGRHVGRRADEPAHGVTVDARVVRVRDAEVRKDDAPVLGEDHVVGLEIAMHDVGRVGRCEARGDLLHDVAHDGQGRPPCRLERRLERRGERRGERAAAHELHREEARPLVLRDVEGASHVSVRHPARELHLVAKPPQRFGRGNKLSPQQLEGDLLVELEVARPIHRAHAARSQQPDDAVAPRQHGALAGELERRSACSRAERRGVGRERRVGAQRADRRGERRSVVAARHPVVWRLGAKIVDEIVENCHSLVAECTR